jgi:fatty-acyl-CoA synthase
VIARREEALAGGPPDATPSRMTPASTYGGLLRHMARHRPRAPAILFGGSSVSWSQLDAEADRYARALLAAGIGKGDVVSLLAGNRPEWLYAFTGAARVGAVVAPLNTWYKDDELVRGITHPGARILLAVDRLLRQDYAAALTRVAGKLPALETVVELSGPLPGGTPLDVFLARGELVTPEALHAAEASVVPRDLVLLLYTSGSTAQPKGVRIHHDDSLENCFAIGERAALRDDDRVWLAVPLFYGFAAVNALPAAWTHGACLILQETFEPGLALELIERERATVYYGFGNITRALIGHPTFAGRELSSLTKGLTGFSSEDKRLAIDVLGVAGCSSCYGLTESYGNCAIAGVDETREVRLQTSGRPLPGWELKVVDSATEEELPRGETGHLLIRGHLTSGYFGDENATRAAFDEEGFFRTGDLALLDGGGRLRFHSRLKELIKVGGINISPLEVEKLIDAHPDVRQVHVVGVPDTVRGEIVVAFVEPVRAGVDPESVRAFVAERAASFKAPAHVLLRSDAQLPRVASGKVPKYLLRAEAIRELGIETW